MKLHAYLKKRDETEDDFAKRTGISRATVFRLKAGQGSSCNGKVITAVVAACDGEVTANELLGIKPRRRSKAA